MTETESLATPMVRESRGIYLLSLVLVAAFIPINAATYALHAVLVGFIVVLFLFGYVRKVRVNNGWVISLAVLYGYGLLRVSVEILTESKPIFTLNYMLWVAMSAGMVLFALNPEYTRRKYLRIRQLTKFILLVECFIGTLQFVFHSRGGMGAGDDVIGTLFTNNSHLFGLMVLNLGVAIFLSGMNAPGNSRRQKQQELALAFFSGIICIVTSFLVGLCYIAVFCSTVLLTSLKGKARWNALAAILFGVVFFCYTQKENAYYIYTFFDSVGGSFIYAFPRKILAILNTATMFSHNPSLLFFGTGPGLYNSRAAMILTNSYLPNKDLGFASMSSFTATSIAPLWNTHEPGFVDSVLNQPWFTVFSLFSEFGIIIFGFIVAYLFKILGRTPDRATVLFGLFLMGTFLLDNLLEFPQYMYIVYVSLWLVYYRPQGAHARTGQVS